MKTPRPPRPTQTNGVQVPAGHRVRDRLGSGHSSNLVAGSDGASGPRMTRRTAVLALGAGLATTLGGCGLRLGKGSPASLPTASTAESARDGLARQATLISSTASVVSQASGTDATTAALAEGVKHTADAQLETLGGVWEPWASQVPSSYPTVAPVPSPSADATTQDLAAALSDGSTATK